MKVIGHRGAAGLAPENTIAAFARALECHVDEIEFDVRVTKDGIPIIHHDSAVWDINMKRLMINEHTYAKLKKAKPDLITLKEGLEYIKARTVAHIEVKPAQPIEPIVKVLKPFIGKRYPRDKLLLASFSQPTLLALHKALPQVPKVVLERWSGVRAHYHARQVGSQRISMKSRWLWWGFIRGFKGSDWKLYAYPLNDPEKARRWASYGLYGAITDYPDRFGK